MTKAAYILQQMDQIAEQDHEYDHPTKKKWTMGKTFKTGAAVGAGAYVAHVVAAKQIAKNVGKAALRHGAGIETT